MFVHGRLTGLEANSTGLHDITVEGDLVRMAGWWGHINETRFDMDLPFEAIPGAYGFRASNQPVVLMATTVAPLRQFHAAGGMQEVRKKSLLLTGHLQYLLDLLVIPSPSGSPVLEVITPAEQEQRGCQLSLLFHDDALVAAVMRQLQLHGVVVDYRKPNCIRVAPCSLYNSFLDVWRFVNVLRAAIAAHKA